MAKVLFQTWHAAPDSGILGVICALTSPSDDLDAHQSLEALP